MRRALATMLLAACAAAFAETAEDDASSDAAANTNDVVIIDVPAVTNAVVVAAATNIVVQDTVDMAAWTEANNRRRIATRTFKLLHASAEEVAERFNSTWGGDFGISWKIKQIAQAFPEANSVMVTAPGVILEACENVIRDIAVEVPQVYIEARFVELQNSASHKLGIDWSMLDNMQGTASFGGGIDRRTIGNAVQNYTRTTSSGTDTTSYGLAGKTMTSSQTYKETTDSDGQTSTEKTTTSTSTMSGRDGSVNYFAGTLSFSDMYLVLSALDSSGDAKIFSNPKIIVSNGKKATVDMTEKYPNVTIASKRTLNGNSESLDLAMSMAAIPGEDTLMFAKEAFFSWGISLEVTPRVCSNGLINVSIVPTISEKSGEVTATSSSSAGSRYPIISVQRLVTDFALASGTTAVIGGLSKTTEESVDSGIPWLRDWPWIGDKLFGRKTRMKVQKEIIVFVTVGVADAKNMPEDVGLPKNAVLGRTYTQGYRQEPGDRRGAVEGLRSLDLRSLEDQANDPANTNKPPESVSFPLPFHKQ